MHNNKSRNSGLNGTESHLSQTFDDPDRALIRNLVERDTAPEPRAQPAAKHPEPKPKPQPKTGRRPKKRVPRLKLSTFLRRPSPKLMVLGVFAMAVLLAPLTIALIILTLIAALTVLLVVKGPQTIALHCRHAHMALARRSPKTAERIRVIAERYLGKAETLVNRLPERLRNNLRFPDLSESALHKEDIALERLRRMAEGQ